MTSGDVFIWVSLDSKRMRLWLETSHWRGSAPSQSQFHLMSVTVGVKHSSNGCVKNGATTCWWNWNRRKRSKSDTVWSFTWNIFLYKYSCTHFFCCCCCCCCCWWCCSLLPLDLMYIFFPPMTMFISNSNQNELDPDQIWSVGSRVALVEYGSSSNSFGFHHSSTSVPVETIQSNYSAIRFLLSQSLISSAEWMAVNTAD